MLASLVLPLLLAAGATAPAQSEAGYYVRAARVHLGDGRVVEDGVVHVVEGRIEAVGRGVEVPEGAALVDHDGHLTAGMVACRTFSGARGEAHDPTRSLLAEARLLDAFVPSHSELEEALEAGITTVVLAATPESVAGGRSAVVKTARGTVIDEEGHLCLSLSAAALEADRFPTSYPGALDALDAALEEPEGVWRDAASGRLPVLIDAHERHEVMRALAFARRHGLSGAIVGAPRAGEIVDHLREADLGVVLGPFGPATKRIVLGSAAALAEAGVPFAFALDAPEHAPASMRLTAALCVEEGLDPRAAWRALTSEAARIAGVADRVGRLERGKDADLVLWSGHPVDLRSRVVAVFIDGERVHRADEGDGSEHDGGDGE